MEELIIQKEKDKKIIIVLDNNKIAEYYEVNNHKESVVGNIYVGIISSVLPKTNTLFIDIGLSKPAYLELKSLDKKYKKGDKILVIVKKDETKNKGAKLTTNIDSSEKMLKEYNKANGVKLISKALSLEDIYLSNFKGKIYNKNENYIDKFGLETEIGKINDKKVWLKSGGNIVIEQTEALTAIDVNVGRFSGKKSDDKESVIFKINKEAAIEVMRQIRLKNIGGMILVDFINMKKEPQKQEIIDIMNGLKGKDRSQIEVFGFTRLGLLEITRKRI